MYESFGDRKIALCRELTKKYEEIERCTLSQAIEIYKEKKPLGEYVLIMEGMDKGEVEKKKQLEYEAISIEEHIKNYMEGGMDKKEAVKRVAKERNMAKSEVYKHGIDL